MKDKRKIKLWRRKLRLELDNARDMAWLAEIAEEGSVFSYRGRTLEGFVEEGWILFVQDKPTTIAFGHWQITDKGRQAVKDYAIKAATLLKIVFGEEHAR